MHIAVVYRDTGRAVDGVLDYARCLKQALVPRGITVTLVLARPDGSSVDEPGGQRRSRRETCAHLRRADVVLIQYSPFGLARWGFAVWLVGLVLAIRGSTRVAMVVHEPRVVGQRGRRRVMQGWQYVQLRSLVRMSSVAVITCEAFRPLVERKRGAPRTVAVGVGSNLPEIDTSRDAARQRLGFDEAEIVVATFGTGHPSVMEDYVGAAIAKCVQRGVRCVHLSLGSGPAFDEATWSIRRPGRLTAGEIAEHLTASDVFLAPLTDGVSRRRTTVMAALQHGLPVIGTDGVSTGNDALWAAAGCVMVPVGEIAAFADALARLALDAGARCRRGQRARAAFEHECSWPVIAERVLSAMDPVPVVNPQSVADARCAQVRLTRDTFHGD